MSFLRSTLLSILIFSTSGILKAELIPFSLDANHGHKSGYKNEKGEIVVPAIYESTSKFSEGLAVVKTFGNKYGYLDESGKIAIPLKYTYAKPFKDGLAVVELQDPRTLNDISGVIDRTGKIVIPIKYHNITLLKSGLYKGEMWDGSGKVAFYDRNGKAFASEKAYLEYVINQTAETPFGEYIAQNVPKWDEFIKDADLPEEPKLTENSLRQKITDELEKWKQKDEFESISDWQARVTPERAAAEAKNILHKIKSEYQAETDRYQDALSKWKQKYDIIYRKAVDTYCKAKIHVFKGQDFAISPYDAENETYMITTSGSGSILLPVPKERAKEFKENWATVKKTCAPKFVPSGETIVLQSVKFGDYVYDSNTKAVYASATSVPDFKPIEISLPENLDYSVTTTGNHNEAPKYIVASRSSSDIDKDIPITKDIRKNTIGIIIANENYAHCAKVEYAANDGQAVKEYFNKTLGIPENQIFTYQDATLSQMVGALDRISKLSDVYDAATLEIILYYAGHGTPNDKDRTAFLIPTDSDPSITETCLSVNRLYNVLAKSNAKSVKVFLDACFSGATRGSGMLVSARGVALKPRHSDLSGNTFVLTATSEDQTAWPYDEKQHGTFTYYLLKKLKETSGNVTLGELTDYVNENVKKTIYQSRQKVQTPAASTSFDIREVWRDAKL